MKALGSFWKPEGSLEDSKHLKNYTGVDPKQEEAVHIDVEKVLVLQENDETDNANVEKASVL